MNDRFILYYVYGMGWNLWDKTQEHMIYNPARPCGCWESEEIAIRESETILALDNLDRAYFRNPDGTITII